MFAQGKISLKDIKNENIMAPGELYRATLRLLGTTATETEVPQDRSLRID